MAIRAFTHVAERGGFTAAGKRLGISGSAVTKCVAWLEEELGVQLFVRTTRHLALTDYGQEYCDRCLHILVEMDEAESAMRKANRSPQGLVRALMPHSFGHCHGNWRSTVLWDWMVG
jgi:DNA-binding transcriptional LysR family regulator